MAQAKKASAKNHLMEMRFHYSTLLAAVIGAGELFAHEAYGLYLSKAGSVGVIFLCILISLALAAIFIRDGYRLNELSVIGIGIALFSDLLLLALALFTEASVQEFVAVNCSAHAVSAVFWGIAGMEDGFP
jgi:hypothetical protein